MKKLGLLALALFVIASLPLIWRVAAQTTVPSQQYSISYGSGPVTSCPAPAAGAIIDCAVTGIGIEESVNGAPYTPLVQAPSSAVVTSFNGRTGAVTSVPGDYSCSQVTNCPPPSPVTSVNGKTGQVVLSLQ